MPESKYEKLICRKPELGDHYHDYLVNTQTMPSTLYSNGTHPIKEANQFVEVKWIWAPNTLGEGESHYHPYDEMFLFIGVDKDNPTELGAEVELWLGDEEKEKLTFDTTSLIFVPRGLKHLPIVTKRVDRPFVVVVIGINSGEHEKTDALLQ